MSRKLSGKVAVIVCDARPVLSEAFDWNDSNELMRDGKRMSFVRESSAVAWLIIQREVAALGAYVRITDSI